ncbi:MAG: cobalamin-dependent protein [Spirochaetales bacterium]|nr:cobalamin-dependent protein [Spirochaetales bacterium]
MDTKADYYNRYFAAMYDTDRDAAMGIIQSALDDGSLTAEELLIDVISPSILKLEHDMVQEKKATLAQHYICSKISSEMTDWLLEQVDRKIMNKGVVILGTAFGDFHGLGKKIVGCVLNSNLYRVIDIGVNVSPETFVDTAVKNNARIIGVSSMMIHTAIGEEGARGVCSELERRGLRDKIKVIVGGAPFRFDDQLYKQTGADGWSPDAIEAVKVVDRLMKEKANV